MGRPFVFICEDEARALLRHILASELPEETKTNARLRQACADGRTDDAAALRKRLDVLDAPPVRAGWLHRWWVIKLRQRRCCNRSTPERGCQH